MRVSDLLDAGPNHKERRAALVDAVRRHPLRGHCRCCGGSLAGTHHTDAVYCGRSCYRRAKKDGERERQRSGARLRRAERRRCVAESGTVGSTPIVGAACRVCGASFLRLGYQWASDACSLRCARRFAATCGGKARRRERESGGVRLTRSRRLDVFERDGWVCRICGDPLSREAEWPALDSPVVDHRIPLAAGGAHDPSNWQAAHAYCNAEKGDSIGFEFADVPEEVL